MTNKIAVPGILLICLALLTACVSNSNSLIRGGVTSNQDFYTFKISPKVEYLVFLAEGSTWQWRIQATSGHLTEQEFRIHIEDRHVRIEHSGNSRVVFSPPIAYGFGDFRIGTISFENDPTPHKLVMRLETAQPRPETN